MNKTKAFDCVEMKKKAQIKLMQEYEKRKNEFKSYVEFINAIAETDPKIAAFRKTISRPHGKKIKKVI
jgi:hypothetical protein